MKIVLLQDFLDDNGVVRVTHRPSRRLTIGWYKGALLDASDATAADFIKNKVARKATAADIKRADANAALFAATPEAPEAADAASLLE